jgi:hypothetical protein|nr:MAG TPA: hypothetical protein [Caudoviricetes sp.]
MKFKNNFSYLTFLCFINLFISVVFSLTLFFLEVYREYGIIETNSSLLGFSLAALGIFVALPLRPEIKERLHQYQYDKIISFLMIVGMMSFFLGIIIYLFIDIFAVNIFFLIWGILQEIVAMYYITMLFLRGR